jgi:hypothetical protein
MKSILLPLALAGVSVGARIMSSEQGKAALPNIIRVPGGSATTILRLAPATFDLCGGCT